MRRLRGCRTVLVAAAVLASCLGMVAESRAAGDGAVGSTVSGSPAARPAITLNRPAGTEDGHVMVASVVVSDETIGVTAPDGWTLVRDDAVPGALRQAVYLKRAGADEPAGYTWTLSEARRVAGGITAYEGVADADPIDTTAVALDPEPAAILVAPEITTTVPGARLILLTAAASDGKLAAGPGLTKRWQISSGDPGTDRDVVASGADALQPGAGPTPTLAMTTDRPGPAISALLALRPAGLPLPPDGDPPDTSIDAGPPATVTTTTATFVFSADEPAGFTCALDDAAPVTCSSPTTYTGLAGGPHRLTVVATDTAGNADPTPPTREWTVEEVPSGDPVLVGAGDIADCDTKGAETTAALVKKIPGTVFTLGDNAYTNGMPKEFARCYDPTWGQFKDRTMPAVGNHEYQKDKTATGYYEYFGAAAGDPRKGYYDYTLGSWHVVVLNSECNRVGGCGAGSPQEQWLRGVLASSKAKCTVAMTHEARFSSARAHGSASSIQPLWQALYDYGADLVLSGHDHVYERFGLQKPGGGADAAFGLRQFVVGTGGRDHRSFGTPLPNSEVRNDDTYGVLKLTLHPDSYGWEFVPQAGKAFTDQGTAACHDAPRPVTLPPPPDLPGPIVPRGTTSAQSPGPAATLTLDRPARVAPGDVMVAAVIAGDSAATIEAPPDWALVRRDAAGDGLRQAVYAKTAGPDEPGSYPFRVAPDTPLTGGIAGFGGVDPNDPVLLHGAAIATREGTDLTPPPLPPTVEGAYVVRLVAASTGAKVSGPWIAALRKPARTIVVQLALRPGPYEPEPPPATETPPPSTTTPTS